MHEPLHEPGESYARTSGPVSFLRREALRRWGCSLLCQMATPVTAEEYVSVDEAARLLGVSKRTLWRRIAAGELPTVMLGPHKTSPVRIRRDVLTGYIEFMKEPHADE
jgi:excisionase family DNA binding protein